MTPTLPPTTPSPQAAVETCAPPAPAPPRRRRGPTLRTVGQVVAYVATVIRRVEGGELDQGRARTVLYGCQVIGQLLQGAELERRLEDLEAAAARRLAS